MTVLDAAIRADASSLRCQKVKGPDFVTKDDGTHGWKFTYCESASTYRISWTTPSISQIRGIPPKRNVLSVCADHGREFAGQNGLEVPA